MRSANAWLGALCAVLLSACGHLQHNDVMVFGTDTKIAFDISANATAGATPEFTLGYKRREGVWMPLLVNGRQSVPVAGAAACRAGAAGEHCRAALAEASRQIQSVSAQTLSACLSRDGANPANCVEAFLDASKYVSERTTPGENGEPDVTSRDAYSVFASLGADFSGSTGGRAALAQFFATGIAAQELAANTEIQRALAVETPGAEQLNDMRAQRNAAVAAAERAVAPQLARLNTEREQIAVCFRTRGRVTIGNQITEAEARAAGVDVGPGGAWADIKNSAVADDDIFDQLDSDDWRALVLSKCQSASGGAANG